TFGTFFYAQRLDLPVREVAGVVATVGMLGVVAAAGGALLGGFLSDKLKRRRLFVLAAAFIFIGGALAEAFAWSLPQLIIGAELRRRGLCVRPAAWIFTRGALAAAFAWPLPQLISGAGLMQFAIGVFATVHQAIVYAIIPDRAESRRYMAVVAFAQKIPSAI